MKFLCCLNNFTIHLTKFESNTVILAFLNFVLVTTKLQIAKILIVFGFLLSIANYSVGVFNFYTCDDKTSVVLEENENSEQKEKESSEKKDDHKEKDKISQFYDDKEATLSDLFIKQYPELYISNSSVYLEHKTPPPKRS